MVIVAKLSDLFMVAITVFILLMSLSNHSIAEMYQWRDEDGKLHFSDKKPVNIAAEKKTIVTVNHGVSFADQKDVDAYKHKRQWDRKR